MTSSTERWIGAGRPAWRIFPLLAGLALLIPPTGCAPEQPADLERTNRDPAEEPSSGSRPDADGSRPSTEEPPAAVAPKGPFFRAAADRKELGGFTLVDAAAGDDGAIRIAPGQGKAGTDPIPTGYDGGSFYNGKTYRYAVATSPEWTAATPFDSVTPSFEASTPPGTWVEIKIAARIDGAWTKDYNLGVWAEDDATVRRHSVNGQADANGNVATDTLELKSPAQALRVSMILFSAVPDRTPTVRAVSAIATKRVSAPAAAAPGDRSALGKILAVPKRSQMPYPGGGEVWCSPTSTSMLLGYWADQLTAPGLRETPPVAAARCLDHVYDGTGNWTFNTAHAAAMDGGRLHAAVTRLSSFGQVEQLVAAGIPVAISVRYGANELTGSPIPSTAGHLLVVRGFAADGDVVCNDPAFDRDATVQVTYDRAQLTKAWQRSLGTTYLVWPATKTLPVDPAGAFY
jgi:hypothetical protein